ncbi:PARP6 polymerase, partial [Polypterus senegalus]
MLRLSCQSLCLQDVKGQYWTDDDSDGDNDSEEFLYGIQVTGSCPLGGLTPRIVYAIVMFCLSLSVQGSCAADLYRHPQLDVDIEAVKEIYSDTAVSVRCAAWGAGTDVVQGGVSLWGDIGACSISWEQRQRPFGFLTCSSLHREYGTIDDVDIDLQINISFLDEEVATAWKVIRTEPIILRLRFSLSQYLDGPGGILSTFTSQQWKHLSNDFLKTQQEKRHSWFKAGGTIKKFRAGLSIFSPIPKSPSFPLMQDSALKGKLGVPELRVTRLMNRSISCTMKNPKGELFGYPTASQSAAVPAARPPPQITMKQLIELFFSSQAGGHCKNIPTLEYGFLVQIMKYAEQRIPTLNEYCVVCDEQHVFQNGSMLKPAVCTRELCVFSFYTLGVMSGAAEEVATGAEVVDLLVAMCRAALESPRKSIIFEPYPSVVDPNDPKTLAFNPKGVLHARCFLLLLLHVLLSSPLALCVDFTLPLHPMWHPMEFLSFVPTEEELREASKGSGQCDVHSGDDTGTIISSNRSHIVKLPLSRQLKFMHTSHQFLLLSSPPAKEARFRTAKKLYGSTFAFHGSHIENWHSILRNGLVNASYTKLQRTLALGEYGVHWVLGYLLASLWQGWTTSCRGSSEFSPMGIFFGGSKRLRSRFFPPALRPVWLVTAGKAFMSWRATEATVTSMGKGQHRMPSKDELVQRYNRMNTIPQSRPIQSRFLQSRNLNCIALCEVFSRPGVHVERAGDALDACARLSRRYEDGQVGDANINTQEPKIQKEIMRVIGTQVYSG